MSRNIPSHLITFSLALLLAMLWWLSAPITDVPKNSESNVYQWYVANAGHDPLSDEELKNELHQGAFANLGFSEDTLVFLVAFKDPVKSTYLTVSPTYLDDVAVTFYDAYGTLIERQVKGDKAAVADVDFTLDIGHLVFPIPSRAHAARLHISSTSNLRANLGVGNLNSLLTQISYSLVIKTGIIVVLFLAGLVALLVGLTSRNSVYLYFCLYQWSWVMLLFGISNYLVTINPSWSLINGEMVSIGAIGSSVSGTLFYAKVMRLLVRNIWCHWIMTAVVSFCLANLGLYLFVDERLGLELNIIALSLASLVLLMTLPFWSPKDCFGDSVLKLIRWPFSMLLVFVLVSSVSGLGQGHLFSLTYLHAIITTLLCSCFLLFWFQVNRRREAAAAEHSKVLEINNTLLSQQAVDRTTLLAMLSHEIKTPLTTLKLHLFKSPLRQVATNQMDHILPVLDQTDVMSKLDYPKDRKSWLDIADILSDLCKGLKTADQNVPHLRLRVRGKAMVKGDHFAVLTIIKNLLDNAIKYSAEDHLSVLLINTKKGVVLRVTNSAPLLSQADVLKAGQKYWRGRSNPRKPGTGLGLWIITNLCRQQGYQLHKALRRERFVATVRFFL